MFPLAPLDCSSKLADCGDVVGDDAPAPTALIGASVGIGTQLFGIGPGGWLIGDGLSAAEIPRTAPPTAGVATAGSWGAPEATAPSAAMAATPVSSGVAAATA